jgi:copper oxidase (laccase) domain-containing protein
MTASLEFLLAQSWTRGLRFCFESAQASQSLLSQKVLKTLQQVHGTDLLSVSSPSGVADGWVGTRDAWAASTLRPAILTADCAPLVYVDRDRKLLALVHAGWRGLRAGIHLQPFHSHGFDPRSTWIWCGPCLNGSSFEVQEDMWSTFSSNWFSNPEIFAPTHQFTKHDCFLHGAFWSKVFNSSA